MQLAIRPFQHHIAFAITDAPVNDGVGFGEFHLAHAALSVPSTTTVKNLGGEHGLPRSRKALEPGFQGTGTINALRGSSGHSVRGILRRQFEGKDAHKGSRYKNIRSFHPFMIPLAIDLLFKKIFFAFASSGTFARMIAWLGDARQS